MRETFHAQLTVLTEQLVAMCQLSRDAMDTATDALLHADLDLAEHVISSHDAIDRLNTSCENKTLSVLARQAPVAGDLRQIVSRIRIAADIHRMGGLAVHVAKLTRRRHPNHVLPHQITADVAELGRLALALADAASEVLDTRDPQLAETLQARDDALDQRHTRLLRVVMDPHWSHGVETAIDAALLGRFYERYGDHAVRVAHRVSFLATGKMPQT